MINIVLGSSSPRRKSLLNNLFQDFTIIHPDIVETPHHGEAPLEFVKRIAFHKLMDIYHKVTYEHALIITCDTIVTIDNEILGKPYDEEHAYFMLLKLSGKTHQVISSISMAYKNGHHNQKHNDYEITNVTFKLLSPADIKNYLSKINFLDKAGSYAAQEYGEDIIQKIDGSL
ncbi:MAG TPA: Maf family protein, partial [Spirochaetota bacterium]|nr:Maf family protein [Spirochaetota bacterium]